MKNETLKKILETYKTKSNKELSTTAMSLHNDFQVIKKHMVELAETMVEIENVYDKVLTELQTRLRFETPKKPTDANGD